MRAAPGILPVPEVGPDSNSMEERTGVAPDCPARQWDTAGFELRADFKLHRKRGQLGTLMCGAHLHRPPRSSHVGLECPYLHPGNHFLSGPARKEREQGRDSTHPPRLPRLPVSRSPRPLVPTGPAAPACAAFQTPGRSEGTQHQSAPAPAHGGRSVRPCTAGGTALTRQAGAGAQAPDSTQTGPKPSGLEGQFQRVTGNRNWTSK